MDWFILIGLFVWFMLHCLAVTLFFSKLYNKTSQEPGTDFLALILNIVAVFATFACFMVQFLKLIQFH